MTDAAERRDAAVDDDRAGRRPTRRPTDDAAAGATGDPSAERRRAEPIRGAAPAIRRPSRRRRTDRGRARSPPSPDGGPSAVAGESPTRPPPSRPEAERPTSRRPTTSARRRAAADEPGPRTVGRLIADALRTAGVRYAFTVPGESFLGLLDALGDAGIRVVATRHEGGAAFMAEAHGQLTGRPAACLGTRAVGAANLAIGIHTARQDSTPMFALVGQVERAHRGSRGVPGDRPGRDDRWPGQVGRRAARRRRRGARPWPRRSARRSAAGPARSCSRCRRTCSTQPAPDDARVDGGRPGPARPSDDEIRAVIELLASARAAGHPGRRRRPPRPDLDRAAPVRRAPAGPDHRRVAAGRRHLERPPALPRDGRARCGRVRARATRRRRRDARHRLPAERADVLRGRDPADRDAAGPTSTSSPCRGRRPRGRPTRPSPPTPGRSCAPPTSGCSARPSSMPSSSDGRQAHNADGPRRLGGGQRRRRRCRRLDGTRRPSRARRSPRSAASCPTTRSSRRMPATSPAGPAAGSGSASPARSSVRRPGRWATGSRPRSPPSLVHRDRPVVALVGDGGMAMTMAELETAVREHARIIVLVFDNERYGTIRMWQETRGTGEGVGHGARAGRLRGDRPGAGRPRRPRRARRRVRAGAPRRRSPRSARPSSSSRSTGAGSPSTARPCPTG